MATTQPIPPSVTKPARACGGSGHEQAALRAWEEEEEDEDEVATAGHTRGGWAAAGVTVEGTTYP